MRFIFPTNWPKRKKFPWIWGANRNVSENR